MIHSHRILCSNNRNKLLLHIITWMDLNLTYRILYDSIYMMFVKLHNYRDEGHISWQRLRTMWEGGGYDYKEVA